MVIAAVNDAAVAEDATLCGVVSCPSDPSCVVNFSVVVCEVFSMSPDPTRVVKT